MASYLRALREPSFRNLFLGQSASALGDQVVFVALALYITEQTGSATDLGLVLAAGSLPLISFVLFGGVWADRLPRQRIMLVADAARAILHAILAASIFAGGASVAEMVVIEALFGTARAFFQPAYTGLIPQTISDLLIQDARALTSTTSNLAALLGPALGTAIVVTAGAGVAFALDAATFVVSALFLTQVHPRPRGEEPSGPRPSVLHDLRGGWREVRSRAWVWATIAAFTVAVLAAYTQWSALAPGIARDHYGSAGIFGLFETAGGAGAVIGALVAVRWRPQRPLSVGLLLVLLWPLAGLALALHAPVVAVLALMLMGNWGFSLFEVWWETALVRHIPPTALSRVSSYDWMGSLALMPIGFIIAGPLANAFGATTVLGVGSALGLVVLILARIPHSTRHLGDPRPAPAEEST